MATCKDDNDDNKKICAARNAPGTIHNALTWDVGMQLGSETGIFHGKKHDRFASKR